MLYDRDIREPLFAFLENRYGKVRILEEHMMGKSRADVVLVTEDSLIGIEIKSDADTYARLARQVRDYDRYYDRNICVAGVRHALHIEEHVPESWGIIMAEELPDGSLDFYVARNPGDNPKIRWEQKMSILWRRELAHLQERNGLPRYPGKSKAYVAKVLCDRVDRELLRRQVCDELFERDYTTIEAEIADYRKQKNPVRKRSSKGRRKTR